MAADAQLNLVDRALAWLSPQLGVRRLQARLALAHYEAARPSKQRKMHRTSGAPDHLVGLSAAALRNQTRYLARNHDLFRGALDTLVANTVGPKGIGVEFQPKRADGSIHTEYAAALNEAFRDWCAHPEVTFQHDWPAAQRLAAATWLRDGEVFGQHVVGPVALLNHGTRVPYSLELLEPDLVPLDEEDEARGIRQGIERSAWGRAVAYHVYRGHPEDVRTWRTNRALDLKRVPAERMLHLASRDRIGQLRGVSHFAAVITRIEDLKDYEESERIAAKVAAMMTAFVKRNSPEGYDPAGMERDENGNLKPRDLRMSPGMIIDTLAVGEEIGLIDSNRPNPQAVAWREGQLRAFAAGTRTSFSSIARNYNGTYSAQRQELVEQFVHYATLAEAFASGFVGPVVRQFILAADLSGEVPMPRDLRRGSWDDVLYTAPSMPWIDPVKEVTGWMLATQAGFASEYEVLRKQGKDPRQVLEQIKEWRRMAGEAGLVLSSDARYRNGGAATDPAPGDGDDTNTGAAS